MIFAVGSSIIVCLVIVFLGVTLFGSRVLSGKDVSRVIPYNINTRAVPNVKQLTQLFPATLGTLKRGGNPNGTLDNFQTAYSNPQGTVTIKGGQAISMVAARQIVEQTGTHLGNGQQADKSAFNYNFFYPTDATRLIWSHNEWYFDAQATSKATLDEFMKAFPY